MNIKTRTAAALKRRAGNCDSDKVHNLNYWKRSKSLTRSLHHASLHRCNVPDSRPVRQLDVKHRHTFLSWWGVGALWQDTDRLCRVRRSAFKLFVGLKLISNSWYELPPVTFVILTREKVSDSAAGKEESCSLTSDKANPLFAESRDAKYYFFTFHLHSYVE